jgi:uncharacterized membrane protein
MAKSIKPDKRFFYRLDAHYRLLISVAVSAIVFFLIRGHHEVPILILLTWIAFALTIIIMDWLIISTSHPQEVRKIAKLQDSSRLVLFLFVIFASIASIGAILFLLKSSKGHSATLNEHILLAICSVIISWWLVHTVFTLLYAHLYYDIDTDKGKKLSVGGLDFPGKEAPDYLDFVYFSFVIGMTFQVSDVVITSKYNTAILALSINVISGLVSQ